MCECLQYEGGSVYLCEACAPMWREFERSRENGVLPILVEAMDMIERDGYSVVCRSMGLLTDDGVSNVDLIVTNSQEFTSRCKALAIEMLGGDAHASEPTG